MTEWAYWGLDLSEKEKLFSSSQTWKGKRTEKKEIRDWYSSILATEVHEFGWLLYFFLLVPIELLIICIKQQMAPLHHYRYWCAQSAAITDWELPMFKVRSAENQTEEALWELKITR